MEAQRHKTIDREPTIDDALEDARRQETGIWLEYIMLPAGDQTDSVGGGVYEGDELPGDHPLTDSNLEVSEVYEKGPLAAADESLAEYQQANNYVSGEEVA